MDSSSRSGRRRPSTGRSAKAAFACDGRAPEPGTARPELRLLPPSFFLPAPDVVAPRLLGKLVVRRYRGRELRARIVETEAYLGQNDPAAHAAAGLTRRTAPLFGPPGHAYIYLIYGMHLCLNVSTRPDGEAGGVLFRALQALPEAHAAATRPLPTAGLSGPGRLTRGLHVTVKLNGCDLTQPGPLFLADDGWRAGAIAVGPRVGIRKAVDLPCRFFLEQNPCVSRPRGPVLQHWADNETMAAAPK